MVQSLNMTAKIIDGKALAEDIKIKVKAEATVFQGRVGRPVGLAVVLVGDDPASATYVANKERACAAVGILSRTIKLPATITEAELITHIHTLNVDDTVDGILVQLPLPRGINSHKVTQTIDPSKDVDGFTATNAGGTYLGIGHAVKPCTPAGCMRLIESTGIEIAGKKAVVIGRSNIVGKPMAMMLLHADATVTMAHSKTIDLATHTREADIVVVAAGVPNLLTADMVKPRAVIIDVGINRRTDGTLCGDVDFNDVVSIAGHITPVPGGVGPMTIAMLLENTIAAAMRRRAFSD